VQKITLTPQDRSSQDRFSQDRFSEDYSLTDRFDPDYSPQEQNWSASVQTILDHPPARFPYQMIWGGIAFCIAFGAWAYLGHIDEVGQARGQLVAGGDVYKVNPVELGKVTNIMVKEGQKVSKGQVVAAMDGQVVAGEVERLSQSLSADRQQLSQMEGLLDRLNSVSLNQVGIAAADNQAQASSIVEAEAKAAALRTELVAEESDAAAHQERLDRLQPLVAQGVISQDRLFESTQALRDRQNAMAQTQGQLIQTTAEIDRLRSLLTLKQAQGTNTLLGSVQQTEQLAVEVTKLKAKIAETEILISNTEVKRNQGFLVSPVDGIVSTLNIRNPGEVVQPGQTVAEISAQNAPLILKATLPNQEAGFIKVGLPVQVKFDAFPYQEYGIVPGKVYAISPDAKPANPNEPADPVYQVYIALDRTQVSANQQTIPFKSGQVASADIVIRRRRIMDVLLDPFRQLQKGNLNL
jgi:hemolysin D